MPGLRTVQTPSSSFQCPVGFLASQRPPHSRLTYRPRSALQDRFCMFFSQKIQNIRQDLDAHPSEPATFSPCDGPKLCLFQPVTEEEIRKLIVESPTKTCMLDLIPTSLTKECLSDLLPLITRIVNSSLCSRKGSFNTTAETSVRKRSA